MLLYALLGVLAALVSIAYSKSIYFMGTVGFDEGPIPGLLPGMSALVEFRR